jgi:sugar O-acyltransferase (sialic acid O-acetyltransferase NeuD family)
VSDGRKVVVFGTGSFAEVVRFYLDHDSPYEVVAFTVHREHLGATNELDGLPVVPFEELPTRLAPADHGMFVAVGYKDVNRVRARICGEAKQAGYELITYVSSKASHWGDTAIGENCFIFEDNTIQPFVTIGDDVILWSGNHVGHHARIGDHCFVTSHVVISGHTAVGPYSFLGVNATLRDNISIGEANVIGAGAIIMRDTADREVYVPARTKPFPKSSDEIGL